ncbi:MAG: type-4 uracil-DNA glycosylase [Candidatus Aenigmatarchaeota archaeon]
MNYEELVKNINQCKNCSLYKQKTNYVVGDGDINSKIVFIGEAPGAEEDKQGKPFVGKAGQYLTKVIKEILGLDRNQVYITNVIKCRPPNNRDPTEEEIKACSPWLKIQLEIIKPEIIITLGRHSTKWIFEYFGLKFESIMKNRGKVYYSEKWNKKIKIIPTLHPAAVLYHAEWKNIFEEDFKLIAKEINSKPKSLKDFL